MNLPQKPESRRAIAVASALAAAGAKKAVLRGDLPAAMLRGVLCTLRNSSGDLTLVDNAWHADPTLCAGESCAWMISGLTSYHAMYDQLYAVRAACRDHHTPILVLVPHLPDELACRDHYEHPEDVPRPWRQQWEPCVVDGAAMFRAIARGGPRNGVLTAIEDFMAEMSEEGVEFAWAHIGALDGLYLLFEARAPWASKLARCLLDLREQVTGKAQEHGSGLDMAPLRPKIDRSAKGKE